MFCEFFGRCGGCAYLDISYEDELALKREKLAETLGEFAGFLGGIRPAPAISAYRNKMEFAFGDEGKDGALSLGIRKKRSFYEVAEPVDCVLVGEDFKAIVRAAIEFFRAKGEAFFHRKRHVGALRHLVLRRGEFTGEILVMLSATSDLRTPPEEFAEMLLAIPLPQGKIVGIMHAENDGVADAVKNENVKLLHGRDYFFEEVCGLRFRISQFSFFQTNSRAAEVLYEIVKEFAGGGDKTALDMYCGTGTIAQIVSPAFSRVVGVEIVEDAVAAARENARANGIENCEFHAGDAFEVLDSAENFRGFSTIILDPPRDGLHPKALAKIAEIPADRIVYVACKPASLARDLPALLAAGYSLEKIEAVDLFPRTPHVECVALLTRK